MKSGTSYLQRLSDGQQASCSQRGSCSRDRRGATRSAASLEVLELRPGGTRGTGAWQGLRRRDRRWPGRPSFHGVPRPGRPGKIERGRRLFPGHRVSVVFTARDLNRSVPAMWQETIQNGRSFTFEEYVAAMEQAARRDRSDDDLEGGPLLLARADHGRCRRWSHAVGVENCA